MQIRTRSRKQAADKSPKTSAKVEIQELPISELHPHPRNEAIRKHPEPGSPRWETLKRSLQNDYFDPIVWNRRNGQLVSGHLRVKLLTELGYTHADVSVVDYDEPTHLARLLAANNTMGEDDNAAVDDALQFLSSENIDLALAGFDEEVLKQIEESITEDTPPSEFPSYDESIETEYTCPKCSYAWSGRPK